MRVFLSLLFILSTSAFADYFDDGWPIYIYGDVQSVEMIFNAIAMIIGSDTYQTALEITVFLGILITLFAFVSKFKFMELIWGGGFIILFIGLLTASPVLTKVHIIDKRVDYGVVDYGANPSYAVVNNVPLFISIPASLGSLLSYGLTDIVDTATSAIDPDAGLGSFNRMGYGGNLNLAYDILPLIEFQQAGDTTIAGAQAPCNSVNRYGLCMDAYIQQCGLESAVAVDRSKLFNFTNPALNQSLLENISPLALGITGNEQMKYDSVPYSCGDMYNILASNASPILGELNSLVATATAKKNIDFSSPATQAMLEQLLGLDDSMTYMTGASRLEDFMFTMATSKTIANAMLKSGMGQDYSVTDYTGDILNYRALAKSNIEGSVTWNFISNVLPLAIHFIMLVAYGVGVFVALFAVLYGWARGGLLVMNYMMNLVALSMMLPILAFVHNLNNYFSQAGGIEGMMQKGRAGSLGAMPYLSDYMATMGGIAGFMGLATILGIPYLVTTGKVSSLLNGAASAIGGMRASTGRDAASAARDSATIGGMSRVGTGETEAVVKDSFKEKAMKLGWSELMSPEAAWKSGGLAGQSSGIEDNLKAGMLSSDMNAKMTTARVSTDITSGIKMLESRQNEGLLDKSGRATNLMERSMATNHGAEAAGLAESGRLTDSQRADYIAGTSEMKRQQLGKTAGFAPGDNSFDMYEAGRREGAKGRAGIEQNFNAEQDRGVFGKDGRLSDAARQGIYNQASDQAVNLLGAGSKSFSDNDWKQKEKRAGTEYEGGFRDAKGFNAATNGTNPDGTDRKEQYLTARENKAMLDTAGMMGSTQGKMEEIEKRAERTGESIVRAAESLDRSLSGAKTRGDSVKVEHFGDEGFRALSAKSELNSLDNRAKTLEGEQLAGKIDGSGALTSLGAQGVRNDSSFRAGEQMWRALNMGDPEKIRDFFKNGLSKLTQDEQAVVLRGGVEAGILLEMPEKDKDGKFDLSNLKVASGAQAAAGFGRGAGNRLFDKMGGAVFGGFEFNGNTDAVRVSRDSSYLDNNSRVSNQNIEFQGEARKKIYDEAIAKGATHEEALEAVETADTYLQGKQLAEQSGLTDLAAGLGGGAVAGKAIGGGSGGATAPAQKGLKKNPLSRTKAGMVLGGITAVTLGNDGEEQITAHSIVNKGIELFIGEEGNRRAQEAFDRGDFLSGVGNVAKGLVTGVADLLVGGANVSMAAVAAMNGDGEGKTLGERFSSNLDTYYKEGVFGYGTVENLAFGGEKTSIQGQAAAVQVAQAQTQGSGGGTPYLDNPLVAKAVYGDFGLAASAQKIQMQADYEQIKLGAGGIANVNNPFVAQQLFANNPQALESYNQNLFNARSNGFNPDTGVLTAQMSNNGQVQFGTMSGDEYAQKMNELSDMARSQTQGILDKSATDMTLMSTRSMASRANSGIEETSEKIEEMNEEMAAKIEALDKKMKRKG